MLVKGNQVHGNGQDGINVAPGAKGNRILSNDAANNNTTGYWNGFDLHDYNANCDGNTWFANIWGSGGYNPACTAAGGSGPNPPAPAAAAVADPSMAAASAPSQGTEAPVTRHLPPV